MLSFGVNTEKHTGFYRLYKKQHFRIEKYLCGTVIPLNSKGKTFQKAQNGQKQKSSKRKGPGFWDARDKVRDMYKAENAGGG